MNKDVPSGIAVRVTVVPSAISDEQVGPQLMPDVDEMVPPPPPCFVTWTVKAATQAEASPSPASADQRTPPVQVWSGYWQKE